MDSYTEGPPPFTAQVYPPSRPRLPTVPSSDEDNDVEETWPPEAETHLSSRSDEGYNSHRRNLKSDDASFSKGESSKKQSETSGLLAKMKSEDVVFATDDSGSISSLRISSDEDVDDAKVTLSDDVSPSLHSTERVSSKCNTNLTAIEKETSDENKKRKTPNLTNFNFSPHLGREDQNTETTEHDEDRETPNSTNALLFYPYTKSLSPRENKSSSSPDLYGSFFSKTPLYVTNPGTVSINRPGLLSSRDHVIAGPPYSRAQAAASCSRAKPDQPGGANHALVRQGAIVSGLQDPPTQKQDAQPYQHHTDEHGREQQNTNWPLQKQLVQLHTHGQQQRPESNITAQSLHQQHQHREDQKLDPPQTGSDHVCCETPQFAKPLTTLGKSADETSSLAAETTSQLSSVSSCYSLTDNINNNARGQKSMDFGYLKSAMKRSSQSEGQSHRRLSLFNTVMRRVSIHRRDSTPTGRIATFLFGVDDSRETDKKYCPGPEVKEVTGEELLQAQRDRRTAQLRESLFLILSGLYGIVLVILGAVIPITEIFIPDDIESTFESFYVYLYGVSILFLVYVYAYLLRRNRLKTEFLTRTLSKSLLWTRSWAKNWVRADSETRGKFRKRMISLDVSNHHTGTFYLRLGVLGFGIGSMIHSGLNFGSYVSVSGEDCSEAVQSVKPLIHLVFTFFQLYFIFMNSKMCIHRYKKLARFGLVHMCATNICVWFRSIVVETLHVINHSERKGHHEGQHGHGGQYQEEHLHIGGDDHVTITGNSSFHHGGYSQKGSGQESDYGAGLTSPGYYIQTESIEHGHTVNVSDLAYIGRKLHAAVSELGQDAGSTVTSSNTSAPPRDDCHWTNMMSQAVEAAGPYLYPCTIEYSLMCAGILYIMWRNVGKRPRRPTRSELETDSEDGEDEEEQRAQRMSVDCTSSSRGLFLGILLMVGTIISIIAFYMLVHQEELKNSALILTHLSGTFIYTVTLLALILAAGRMKNLSFHHAQDAGLEDILILISYTGLLAFIIFSLIASILAEHSTMSTLTVLSNVSMLLQATLQTIFMLAGDRMSAASDQQVRKKPGREFITFLLISNFAMWAINTFETQTPHHNPIQVDFYGPEAWAIFTHISVPLGIYYRFHSTVCFSNIWKNAWKKRKHL